MLFEQAMEIDDPGRVVDGAVWSHTGFDPDDGADLRALLQQMRGDRQMEGAEPQILPGLPGSFDLDLTSRKQSDGFLMFGQAPDDEDVTEVEPIVVEGRGPPTAVSPGWGDDSEYPPVPDGGGGGGGQSEGDPDAWLPEPEDYDRCQDRAADVLADEIAREIADQPDSHRREYASLIWKDANGVLHRTDLIPGDNFSVDWSQALDPSVGFNSFSQVVGLVHNHPSEIETSPGAGDWSAVDPSWNFEMVWAGDWRAADRLVFGDPDVVGDEADWANFTMYVVFQGQVREFDWWQNQARSRDDKAHPLGEGTESGDYDPDATCG